MRHASRQETTRTDGRWDRLSASGDVVRLLDGGPTGRLQALYRIGRLLRDGAVMYMTAEGDGREVFSIELPGGPVVVRAGWLTLRRQVRLPTVPVFAHCEASRTVIVAHPPLAPVDDDAARDLEACRRVLTPLVTGYVRRYPTQCRYLAFPP